MDDAIFRLIDKKYEAFGKVVRILSICKCRNYKDPSKYIRILRNRFYSHNMRVPFVCVLEFSYFLCTTIWQLIYEHIDLKVYQFFSLSRVFIWLLSIAYLVEEKKKWRYACECMGVSSWFQLMLSFLPRISWTHCLTVETPTIGATRKFL